MGSTIAKTNCFIIDTLFSDLLFYIRATDCWAIGILVFLYAYSSVCSLEQSTN